MNIENLIRRGSTAEFTNEYGVQTRRLFPWKGVANTKRPLTETGCMYVSIPAMGFVEAHNHDEEETFIVLEGEAVLNIDGAETSITEGDVVYVPRYCEHSLTNNSKTKAFLMLDVYWDENGASDSCY